MKKTVFITFAIFAIILICMGFVHPNKIDYVQIVENKEGYTLSLYNEDKDLVLTQDVPKEYAVTQLDDTIFQITLSLGSPLNYSFFFDATTSRISPTYENVLLATNNRVIYMDSNKLIIQDLFDQNLFLKKISRNFSPTAVPSSTILKVELTDNNKLQIKYLEGEDYKEVSELIDL